MKEKKSLILGGIIFLLFPCIYSYGSENQVYSEKDIVQNYKTSQSVFETVSQKLTIKIVGMYGSEPDDNGYSQHEIVVHRDSQKIKWVGNYNHYDNENILIPEASFEIRKFFDHNRFIDLQFQRPNNGRDRIAYLYQNKKNIDQNREELLDKYEYGGALEGRLRGNNHYTIADLLYGATNLSLSDHKEFVKGISSYVVEGNTPYGKIKAWISPEYGFNALKWNMSKTKEDLFVTHSDTATHTTLAESGKTAWEASFEFDEIKKINGTYVISRGHLNLNPDYANESEEDFWLHYQYGRSEIDLNPDFNKADAFEIVLPERTMVYGRDTGAQYQWNGQKLVPYIDKLVMAQIDEEVDKLFKEVGQTYPTLSLPPGAVTPETKEDILAQPSVAKKPLAPAQVLADASATQVIKENPQSYLWRYVLIVIVVLIVAMLIFRYRRGDKNVSV